MPSMITVRIEHNLDHVHYKSFFLAPDKPSVSLLKEIIEGCKENYRHTQNVAITLIQENLRA